MTQTIETIANQIESLGFDYHIDYDSYDQYDNPVEKIFVNCQEIYFSIPEGAWEIYNPETGCFLCLGDAEGITEDDLTSLTEEE